MRKRGENGVIILTALFFLAFFGICLNYFSIAYRREYVQTAESSALVTIHAGDGCGTIYDRNFIPLTNRETEIIAVAVPSAVSLAELEGIAAEDISGQYSEGKPFAFKCREAGTESSGLTFFEVPVRYSDEQTAVHSVGYVSEGHGVSGIEYAYDGILRSGDVENSVTYSTDGFGNVLIGGEKTVIRSSRTNTGVVTALDSEIQSICERAGEKLEKGAIVVSDVKNGDILAMASFPDYDIFDLEDAVSDERSPMINRCLYSYSVGSVFKLVTACEGLNEGFSGYMCGCDGSYRMTGQTFRCHKIDGHGIQDMTEAMVNSCNPYFISLSRCLDLRELRSLASSLGFGREIYLCSGMVASSGVLPSLEELTIPAELGNFSFGQGKLTATPLQINQMTCTIANGGELVYLRLIRGITEDGKTVSNEKSTITSRVMTEETAAELRRMMRAAIYENENSNAAPRNIYAAAKTSTAQTGRFDEDDEELCHGWITGFFPANRPRYAVTVLAEDGGYGNESAAPVFREIAEQIMDR